MRIHYCTWTDIQGVEHTVASHSEKTIDIVSMAIRGDGRLCAVAPQKYHEDQEDPETSST